MPSSPEPPSDAGFGRTARRIGSSSRSSTPVWAICERSMLSAITAAKGCPARAEASRATASAALTLLRRTTAMGSAAGAASAPASAAQSRRERTDFMAVSFRGVATAQSIAENASRAQALSPGAQYP